MDLYHPAANACVAGFLGNPSLNFLEVAVKSISGDRATVSNAALYPVTRTARHPGSTARFGLCPQDLSPDAGAGAGGLHGKIARTERLRSEAILQPSPPAAKP